jgi:hypothetical protein
MIRKFTLLLAGCFLVWMGRQQAVAQAPNLPAKATLSQTVLAGKTFSNASQADTATRLWSFSGSYTLEVVAKVNSATGRGLDIEARNNALSGFRLSLDATSLKATSPLTPATFLSATNAGQSQTIRVAVNNDTAFVYQNGAYLYSLPAGQVKDIVNGTESDQVSNIVTDTNLIRGWAGIAPGNTGRPDAYNWGFTPTPSTYAGSIFNTANSGSGVRFMDSSASNQNTYAGSTGPFYSGRVMYIRWDGNPTSTYVYYLPVTLQANSTYNFSMLAAYLTNATGTSRTITIGIGKTTSLSDRLATKVATTGNTRVLTKSDLFFTSQDAGTYYITFTGDWGLYAIADLSMRKFTANSRFVFGKNYPSGAVDMEITSATFESGAWAPSALVNQSRQTVTLTGRSVQVPTTFYTDFVVPGKTDVHFNAEYTPFSNCSVALNSADAWLFFDNIRPDKVISDWLPYVTINGAPAASNTDLRIAIYKNGTVVIPNGNVTSQSALQVFTQPNLGGTAQAYAVQTVNNSLGAFDNKMRSFTLKRGYMATLANNPDGSGFSRVFIANDSDLVVNTMPVGLDTSVSFIRVMKWGWPSKKGKAGWNPDKVNATWYYDWNIGGNSSAANYEYSSIRQTQYWPGWGDITNKPNLTHVLGFNEPDRPDQSNLTVDQAIGAWPAIYSTGLRVGSPAPANPESSWITDFLKRTDSLNYRVDFVAIHCYWGGQTPSQWYSRLKGIYDRVKRPLWITEWNNGANWTTETWPTDTDAQFQKQLSDLKGILQVLDTASFVERYAEYDWVENKRALVLADTLTPAGKYYFANKSTFAYNPAKEYITPWRLLAAQLSGSINTTDYAKDSLSFKDLNGELGARYVLERWIDGRDASFVPVYTYAGYTPGSTLYFADSVYTKATYRVKCYALDTTVFRYSASLVMQGDAAPVAPATLTGNVLSSTQVALTWTAGTNARSYNLKRAVNRSGPYTLVLPRTTVRSYEDDSLTQATTYYYTVTTLNSAGESAGSDTIAVTTKQLVTPTAAQNVRIASGDTRVILTWDFMYDAQYKVLRSTSPAGPYDTIATNLSAVRFTDSTRTNGQDYYYKLLAYNGAGNGPETSLAARPTLGQHVHVGFNENTGTLAADDWGAYQGKLYNGVTWVNGKDGTPGAVSLSKAASSYVQLDTGVVRTINNFTIAAWLKLPADQAANTRVFDFGSGTGTFMILVPRVSYNGGYALRYKITCATGTYDKYMPFELPLNQWVHVTISQQDSVFKLYVNGTVQFTDSTARVKPADMGNTTQNYLGRSQWSTDPYSDHTYDDFRIYNYALSDQGVAALVNGSTLPVTLAQFTGRMAAQENVLSWQTATEQNSDHFILERSLTGNASFTGIARVGAKGNSSRPAAYQYNDPATAKGTYYYRLKQVDKDGRFTYSSVVVLNRQQLPQQLLVYPNPVAATAVVELPAASSLPLQLSVYNAAGQVVLVRSLGVQGSTRITVDFSRLTPGSYRLQVASTAAQYNATFIKQ